MEEKNTFNKALEVYFLVVSILWRSLGFSNRVNTPLFFPLDSYSSSLRRDFTQTFAPWTLLSSESHFPHWLSCLFPAGDTSPTLKMPLKTWSCKWRQYIKISSWTHIHCCSFHLSKTQTSIFRSTLKPGAPPPLPPKVRPKMTNCFLVYGFFAIRIHVRSVK